MNAKRREVVLTVSFYIIAALVVSYIAIGRISNDALDGPR